MKKKTNLQTGADAEGGEAQPRQRGPQKEKTQITIRVDQELMNEVYAQMKSDNTRITDIVERGIQLALEEARHEMPTWKRQVRFMVANATRRQQDLLRGLLIAMVESEVLEARNQRLSPAELKLFEMCAWFLMSRNTVPHVDPCLEWYSRYGKSAEEIAKLEKRVGRKRGGLQVS